ncbi:BrnT family toxin [Campylobacter helveticus]|uniref:BrnT family toxin n=1 Tax=Campylobacter helveticus TaxID=28898 RepID=A0AAX2UFZ3_9BACT|nr:BrnT family toxin [Campylobacter helveticus]ARE80324.1 type II toxin-antitoxin system, ribonuclease toxin BrnT [Campylobacter helveticus]MCR2040489.1 BrnT family toxin [Campylobacter helveticus]MCR2055741.1 BrnT family toxin [Campylobacter helveticus]MCR2057568.1 BrnT family toxin [Campylobacter helveticus]MCR2061154.1 BrnT family toxin [Campylobacter helveticus]
MKFEWDEEKNKTNQIKYGISFDVAREIFDDPFTLSFLDERFNYLEERWISIGQSKNDKIIVVAHLFYNEKGEEIIRIISARKATQKERKAYEKI